MEQQILSLGGKLERNKDESLREQLRKLGKQKEKLYLKSLLKNKEKNIIKEETFKSVKIRFQVIKDLPTKQLKTVIDQGKKEIKEGKKKLEGMPRIDSNMTEYNAKNVNIHKRVKKIKPKKTKGTLEAFI